MRGDVDRVDGTGQHHAVAVVDGTALVGQHATGCALDLGIDGELAGGKGLEVGEASDHNGKHKAETRPHHRLAGVGAFKEVANPASQLRP